jgi:DNA-directed RNA polymerase subunit RPC12/RpoP
VSATVTIDCKIPRDFLFAHFFVLDVPIDLPADCPHCGERRLFRAERECVWGLIAKCTECGEERIA